MRNSIKLFSIVESKETQFDPIILLERGSQLQIIPRAYELCKERQEIDINKQWVNSNVQ